MRNAELPRTLARLAPRLDQLARRRIVVNTRVPVAVRDVQRPVRRYRNVRRPVERLPAERLRHVVRIAQRHQQLALRRPLPHRMIADVRRVNAAVRPRLDVVRRAELTLAPVVDHIARRVQHDYRMCAPVVHEDAVLPVNRYPHRVIPLPPVRQIAPSGHMLIDIFSVTDSETLFTHWSSPPLYSAFSNRTFLTIALRFRWQKSLPP